MPLSRFARFAWGVLAYNLGVIAWGAYVRASGSGAGCGSHWPLCDGQVLPRARTTQLVVELSHRLTSGVALLLTVALLVAAFRGYPRGSLVRRGAVATMGFMLAEALVGAGLVLFALVAHDASLKRALSMSVHLTNTFFLLAAMTLTAYWASGGARVRVRGQGLVAWFLGAAMLAMFVLGMSGAVAALGDTLFPARSLAEGLAQDLSGAGHLFLRLRLWHPFIATLTAALVLGAAQATRVLRPDPRVRTASRTVMIAFGAQYAVGLANVMLLAPIPMQLLHLVMADLVWISLVLLAATTLAEAPAQAPIMSKNGPGPSSDAPPSSRNVAPVT
jgi:heme A synthase